MLRVGRVIHIRRSPGKLPLWTLSNLRESLWPGQTCPETWLVSRDVGMACRHQTSAVALSAKHSLPLLHTHHPGAPGASFQREWGALRATGVEAVTFLEQLLSAGLCTRVGHAWSRCNLATTQRSPDFRVAQEDTGTRLQCPRWVPGGLIFSRRPRDPRDVFLPLRTDPLQILLPRKAAHGGSKKRITRLRGSFPLLQT